jgi:hypothetical protein
MTGVVPDAPAVAAQVASGPGWGRLRLALIAAVAALVVGAGVIGTRAASLSELNAAIVAGRVDQVRVSGALPPGATGESMVRIAWQDGPSARVTQVLELSGPTALPPSQSPTQERIVGDPVQQLTALDASLEVVTADGDLPNGPTVAGWELPPWFGPLLIVVWLATVALTFYGPQPWWGTRWAWFWVELGPFAVVGVPLFLLLSGPPPGIPRPTQLGRRLTGGWAFLLVSAVASGVRSLG